MTVEYHVKDISIHRIVEQELGTRDAFQFLKDLTPELLEENRSWLEPLALLKNTNNFAFCFQSYVIKTPHHNILVDSCIGNDKPRPNRGSWHLKNDNYFMSALAKANLKATDIDYVMCTHLHTDHVGWNTKLENGQWVPTFPNARYLMSSTELNYWIDIHRKTPIDAINDSVLPILESKQAELVKSDHVLSEYVRLMPTPGHTIDHFSVLLGKKEDLAYFTGDLIHTPLQAKYPNLCATVDFDYEQATQTRFSFLERVCEQKALCCTAHFPGTSVGKFTKWKDTYRFIAE